LTLNLHHGTLRRYRQQGGAVITVDFVLLKQFMKMHPFGLMFEYVEVLLIWNWTKNLVLL